MAAVFDYFRIPSNPDAAMLPECSDYGDGNSSESRWPDVLLLMTTSSGTGSADLSPASSWDWSVLWQIRADSAGINDRSAFRSRRYSSYIAPHFHGIL